MRERSAAEWEELARREPYFAVLTTEGARGVDAGQVPTPEFFQTGEEDLQALLGAIASLLGREIPLTSALDFGCGAGRLTLPLARRAARVTACDIAPTMLEHVRRNAEAAGLSNVTLLQSDELPSLEEGQFDFICSLLVFQYIPWRSVQAVVRTLLRLLAPGGVAALQMTLRPGDERAMLRTTRSCGTRAAARFATHHGGVTGAVFVLQKP